MGALKVSVSRKRSAQENNDAASAAKPSVYFSFTSFLSTVVLWSVRCFHLGSMDWQRASTWISLLKVRTGTSIEGSSSWMEVEKFAEKIIAGIWTSLSMGVKYDVQ